MGGGGGGGKGGVGVGGRVEAVLCKTPNYIACIVLRRRL